MIKKDEFEYIGDNIQNTLTILVKNGKFLIGDLKYKGKPKPGIKLGDLTGRQNFPGGKQNKGETIEEASIREFFEETGLKITSQKQVGIIQFRWDNQEGMDMNVFVATDYTGGLKETREMIPKWIDIDKIDYSKLWLEDSIWLKFLLKGEQINYLFEGDENFILKKDGVKKVKQKVFYNPFNKIIK